MCRARAHIGALRVRLPFATNAPLQQSNTPRHTAQASFARRCTRRWHGAGTGCQVVPARWSEAAVSPCPRCKATPSTLAVQAEVWGECTGRWLGLAKGGAGRRTCIESMSSTVHRRMVAMVKAVIRARPRGGGGGVAVVPRSMLGGQSVELTRLQRPSLTCYAAKIYCQLLVKPPPVQVPMRRGRGHDGGGGDGRARWRARVRELEQGDIYLHVIFMSPWLEPFTGEGKQICIFEVDL